MKKLFFSIAVIATISMASCTSSTKKIEDQGDILKAKIENCTNSDSLAIYAAQAQSYADSLKAAGEDKAAEAYLSTVAPVIEQKDPTISQQFRQLTQKVDSTVTAAGQAAIDSTKAVADSAAAAVSQKVEAGKQAVSDAADKAKDKAADAVQAGADKIKDALNNK